LLAGAVSSPHFLRDQAEHAAVSAPKPHKNLPNWVACNRSVRSVLSIIKTSPNETAV